MTREDTIKLVGEIISAHNEGSSYRRYGLSFCGDKVALLSSTAEDSGASAHINPNTDEFWAAVAEGLSGNKQEDDDNYDSSPMETVSNLFYNSEMSFSISYG